MKSSCASQNSKNDMFAECSANVIPIGNDLRSVPQTHFHSGIDLRRVPQTHFHSGTDLRRVPQMHFHSGIDLRNVPQTHFHSGTDLRRNMQKGQKKETHLSVISRVCFYYVITFISFIQVYFSKAACFSLGNKRALRDC